MLTENGKYLRHFRKGRAQPLLVVSNPFSQLNALGYDAQRGNNSKKREREKRRGYM